ncbi:hypothetical protein NB037_09765 [Rathayibacter sp. ZW T2_19]|uniref:Uncharacterized protein n=1 Tax=Rathayibacter rubneri TaxID=2950106 RepID=A0A9X2ISH9_9MICO|nr:hypothetical protein [Rathayibacter rubneri]MCM6762701.1 hypothetical protein [Rathayibacter rubneri]
MSVVDGSGADFLDFSPATPAAPADVTALFVCSTSDHDGGGSVAITADAVYLGEESGILRIDAGDIRTWSSAARGRMFALTVESDVAHRTHLFSQFRTATVLAMTKSIGPEGVLLRAA